MHKSFRLCSTIFTVLCSPIILIHRTSSETLTDNGGNLNIIEVLNTTEDLWLYWETSKNDYAEVLKDFTINETMTCIRNRMKSISWENYYFQQTYLLQGKIRGDSVPPVTETEDYKGVFVNDTNPPKSMTVYDDDEEPPMPVKRMTLQYTEDDGTFGCSVFFTFPVDNAITDSK
ncbi:uncharacterized protein LOC125939849 [Dermacentor silvarum]|uniref:uncharacterized protein LOC125939849 n=1 Tax=Dermacentor silvarum TaxID=543639 RepID=UPI002101C613|nr:uncharacterized protein LOC125939849 [Dermacentor silvarum]